MLPRTENVQAELGAAHGAAYTEWRPPAPLERHVVCSWGARFGPSGEPHTDRILPDGCIDIVWTGRQLLVAGPDTKCVRIEEPLPGAVVAGIRFRPGLAPTFLGVPSSELLDTRADARHLLGDRAALLTDRLQGATSARAAARELETLLIEWLPRSESPDPLVEAAVAALRRSPEALQVRALAEGFGVSERTLHRRCVAAIGYGPKLLHRVFRFRRFLALSGGARHGGLAALAIEAGYADQAHLARDCRELAGLSPLHLVGRLVTAA